MTRWTKLTALASLVSLSVLAAGCSAAASPDPTSTVKAAPSVDMVIAPVATGSHGQVKHIADALGQVPLRADQRAAVESLAAEAEARMTGTLAARHDFATTLSAQVAAGTLDRAALAPKIEALTTAFETAHAKDRAAFEALHDLLDPDQRAAFADAMEAGHHEWHDGRGRGEHGASPWWAEALALTDDQKAAVKQIVHDSFKAMHDHAPGPFGRHHAMLEAFRGETFSMADFAPPGDIADPMRSMTGHVLDAAEKVLPLLSADQRALAAVKIREHADQLPTQP